MKVLLPSAPKTVQLAPPGELIFDTLIGLSVSTVINKLDTCEMCPNEGRARPREKRNLVPLECEALLILWS